MLVWGVGKRRRERVATHRARVRTDEDRSRVRAWRFTRCFSARDAEAVEVVGAELQVLFHVVGWLVGSDVIAISLTDRVPNNPRLSPSDCSDGYQQAHHPLNPQLPVGAAR